MIIYILAVHLTVTLHAGYLHCENDTFCSLSTKIGKKYSVFLWNVFSAVFVFSQAATVKTGSVWV